MPATAGRVRMPANNRVHSSAALQTHGIWRAMGYDPYAPLEEKKDASQNLSTAEPDAENSYASFQGLLALAKITTPTADADRGACKRCGRVGHLRYQCKNYVKVKDGKEEKDFEAMQLQPLVELDKLKGSTGIGDWRTNVKGSDESSDEDVSESSESEIDSEIERIIAERTGKISGRGRSSRKKVGSNEDGSGTGSGKRDKRGRSKKRSGKRVTSDSDDSGQRRRKRRMEHRTNRDRSPDENDDRRHSQRKSRKEKRRRRSCQLDSDPETFEDFSRQHRRRSKRAASPSDTDSSGFDDSRTGRDLKRIEKSGRHRCEDHE